MFQLQNTHSTGARSGILQTAHGTLQTPFFMPIATKGAVKTLSAPELEQLQRGIDSTTDPIVLSNTYHLYLKPGLEILEKMNGLHPFMNWKHSILTDSGGFQIFSLSKLRTLKEDGVEFQSHIDGSRHFLTPERSMEIQSVIGSDIWMAFDYFPGYPATQEDTEHSVRLTTTWFQRCQEWHKNYTQRTGKQHALFAIVQGSTYDALRTQSAEELVALNADGYAIGGLAVGEPPEEMYRVLDVTTPLLPKDKPRYLMGVGTPDQILEAVKRGVDMFDCVMPTRNARHGTLFIHEEPQLVDAALTQVAFTKLNIKAEKHSSDATPLDPHCSCFTCSQGFSRAYVRHLFNVDEPLAARLATIHNISFYLTLMKEIRDQIQAASV